MAWISLSCIHRSFSSFCRPLHLSHIFGLVLCRFVVFCFPVPSTCSALLVPLMYSALLWFSPLDEVTKAVKHFPSFLSSYALIINELPSVDPSTVRYLSSMIGTGTLRCGCLAFFSVLTARCFLGRLMLVYPQMYSKHRRFNCVALTRLFVVLKRKGSALQQLLDNFGVVA